MAVPSNSTVLPAGKNLTRRTMLRVLAASPAAALSTAALAAQDTQQTIGQQICELADELSFLLAKHDGGALELRISAAFQNSPIVSAQPVNVHPKARLEQSISAVTSALNQLKPGAWRAAYDLECGIFTIMNDAWNISDTSRCRLKEASNF